jgi:23S rRNA (uracil1939-C5)-methyltransferase
MKKGDIIDNIFVETMAAEGKCIGKVNGQVIFLEGCAPGDTVSAELTKIKSNFLEGRVTAITTFSPERAQPFCIHFGLCGGCSWQHITYETQLKYKQKQVVDNLERLGGLQLPPVNAILPSANTRFYRNKLDYTFTAQRWLTRMELAESTTGGRDFEPGLGYHIPRKYDKVFDVLECHLQPDPSNAIRLAVRDEAIKNNIPFFDLRKQIGFLRTLTIRTANTGEVMVILQVTYDKMEWIEAILKRLDAEFPEIRSLQYVINGKKNDTFHDLEIICWKGNTFITEQMPRPDGKGVLKYQVGPKSFYQTNSAQAYVLYTKTWEMAKIQPDELVYDLYTGTGTIANFVSANARKVIGLEYVKESIADAAVNASINNIKNTEFFAGDIKDLLNDAFLAQHGKPDVIITDPPRAGMHEDVTRMIVKANPQRIVYVSCNAATQARDLQILCEQYAITEVQPVDMFPHTMHVENIVSLQRK